MRLALCVSGGGVGAVCEWWWGWRCVWVVVGRFVGVVRR